MRRLHVDAAYAGVLGILPEMRHHFRGLELADSFSTNAHKWLLTTFDCSCMWLRDAQYVRAALSLLPAYLRSRGNDHDYKARRHDEGILQCVHQPWNATRMQGLLPEGIARAAGILATTVYQMQSCPCMCIYRTGRFRWAGGSAR